MARKVAEQEKIDEIRDSIRSDAEVKTGEASGEQKDTEHLHGLFKKLSAMGPKGVPLNPADREEYAKLDSEARVLNRKLGALRREKPETVQERGERARGSYLQKAAEERFQRFRDETHEKFQKQHERALRHEQTMETIRKQMISRSPWDMFKPVLLVPNSQPKQLGVFNRMIDFIKRDTKKETIKPFIPKAVTSEKFTARRSKDELPEKRSGNTKPEGINDAETVKDSHPKKYEIPLDGGQLVKYGKDNFGFLQVADGEEFKKYGRRKGMQSILVNILKL